MSPIDIGVSVRPRMGGQYPPIVLNERHRALLHGLADALIPADEVFPPPSAVGIADFVARYLAPAGSNTMWYPFLTADELTARLDAIDRPVDDPQWAAELETLQGEEPNFFATLRDLVYQGYYSHATVTGLISTMIPAARDLHRAPQPYGYLDGLEEWDEALLAGVRGSYTSTTQVRRLALLPDYRPAGATDTDTDTLTQTQVEEGA